jgi:N-6 DNA Methylase/HsdM N-terminal domain
MRWIAPTERDAANETLEKRLWAAADQLRANSGLTAQQYSQPVLGLIFLRFADARFESRHTALKLTIAGSRRGSRLEDPKAYTADGVVYLPPTARFVHLLTLPEGAAVGQAVNDAMRAIERDNTQLAGVLPKTYEIFDSVLLKALLKMVSEIPASLDYDAFGRIYEYFLSEFARTEGQRGGEFYTPSSIVRLLVEVLEPYHGRILDPACGSGGMFVQSARFVAEHRKNPSTELSIHGQEKVAETARLCRMNLAVHGLEGDIKEGITYYDDLHHATGRFDFALANPPFNVNAVDKERLATDVGPGRRFPFGLPKSDNANFLWIQLFYAALSERDNAPNHCTPQSALGTLVPPLCAGGRGAEAVRNVCPRRGGDDLLVEKFRQLVRQQRVCGHHDRHKFDSPARETSLIVVEPDLARGFINRVAKFLAKHAFGEDRDVRAIVVRQGATSNCQHPGHKLPVGLRAAVRQVHDEPQLRLLCNVFSGGALGPVASTALDEPTYAASRPRHEV